MIDSTKEQLTLITHGLNNTIQIISNANELLLTTKDEKKRIEYHTYIEQELKKLKKINLLIIKLHNL